MNRHQLIPRDPIEQSLWRRDFILKLRARTELRPAVLNACRDDILFWINAFVYQFNPKARGDECKLGPFATWGFQDEAFCQLVESVRKQQDTIIEKSREMGASWMCLIVMLWFVLFHECSKFLLISRDADAVDSKDPDSLFWKLRFMIKNLPSWMVPESMQKSTKMYLGNEQNLSCITGEASTGKAGIGGRATAIFVDEFSLIDAAQEVYDHTSDTSSCRIFNFTHRGVNSCAADLCRKPWIKKIQLHWSQHPMKKKGLYRYNLKTHLPECLDSGYQYPTTFPFVLDGSPAGGPFPGIRSPWYDAECQRKGSTRAIAMDLDINPEGSSAQFFEPLVINRLIQECARPPLFEGDLLHDDQLGAPHRLDPREGGNLRLWCPIDLSGRPPQHRYFMGCDISTGSGSTPTCFSVFDADLGEKIAEVTDYYLKVHRAAPLAAALGRLFYEAKIVWEMQGPGAAFGEILIDELGYPAFYLRTDETRLDKKYAEGGKPGWYCNHQNKRNALEDYSEALRSMKFVNPSEQALKECLAFQFDQAGNLVHGMERNKDEAASKVNHGDHVIADALAWKLAKMSGITRARKKTAKEEIPVLSLQWRREYAVSQSVEAPSLYTG